MDDFEKRSAPSLSSKAESFIATLSNRFIDHRLGRFDRSHRRLAPRRWLLRLVPAMVFFIIGGTV